MTVIEILRGSDVFASVKPNTTSSQTKKVMGDNTVTLSFELDRMVNFNVGDWCVIYGENYYLNSMPVVKKKSTYNYQYDLILQSTQYTLAKAQYLFLGDDNTLKQIEFSLVGTAETFIDLLISNVSRVDTGWTKGGVIKTNYKNISFSKEDCFTALKKIADEFGVEYYVEGKKVHLAKQQNQTPFIFRYGRNKGLYEITRTQLQETSIITRLYAYGGTTNIPAEYRNFSQRLLLPNVPEEHLIYDLTIRVLLAPGGNSTYLFNWTAPLSTDVTNVIINYRLQGATDWVGDSGGPVGLNRLLHLPTGTYEFYFSSITSTNNYDTPVIAVGGSINTPIWTGAINYYLENNTDKYGIIEATLILDDIYPQRVGKVTSVDATDIYKFKDNTIDFDVNEYLLPGVAAKLTFNTGQLAGYSFEISKFDNGLQEFTILKNKDEKTLDIPSIDLKPAINDEYVLTDILMPQSYVDNAEMELYTRAKEYLLKNSEAQFNYTCPGDPAYFERNLIALNQGDIVTIEDTDLQVNSRIRVISITRSLINKYEYSFELGEVVKSSKITQILNQQRDNTLLIERIRYALNNNRLLAGTNIGTFTVEGELTLPSIPTGTTGLTPIFIDGNNRIVRGGG